jgi:hypothetical protein
LFASNHDKVLVKPSERVTYYLKQLDIVTVKNLLNKINFSKQVSCKNVLTRVQTRLLPQNTIAEPTCLDDSAHYQMMTDSLTEQLAKIMQTRRFAGNMPGTSLWDRAIVRQWREGKKKQANTIVINKSLKNPQKLYNDSKEREKLYPDLVVKLRELKKNNFEKHDYIYDYKSNQITPKSDFLGGNTLIVLPSGRRNRTHVQTVVITSA